MRDGAVIQFDYSVRFREEARRNIRASLARDCARALPGAFDVPHVNLVAGGPSAASAPLDAPDCAALNGALRLFARRGLAPRFWIACDPHDMVADFVADAPRETVYLVASKCSPRVFDALRDRDVRMWHCPDADDDGYPVGEYGVLGGVSVTLRSFNLLNMVAGATSFDVWGWDGCFGPDGSGHAVPQPEVDAAPVTITVGDRDFESTHVWAGEADDAVVQLRGSPFDVSVHGDGMIRAILDELRVARAA